MVRQSGKAGTEEYSEELGFIIEEKAPVSEIAWTRVPFFRYMYAFERKSCYAVRLFCLNLLSGYKYLARAKNEA